MPCLHKTIATLGLLAALGLLTLTLLVAPALAHGHHSQTANMAGDTTPRMPQHSHHHHYPDPTKPSSEPIRTFTPTEAAAEDWFNQGLEKLQEGDYQGAIANFTQTIQLNPQHEAACFNRGDVRRQLGDYQGAIADYTQALQTNPDFTYLHQNRGKAYEAIGDYQAAIADYTQALTVYPEEGNGFSNRGAVRAKLGDIVGALADFNQAIQINPGLAHAYFNRGNFRWYIGNHQGAIADYQIAAQLFSEQGNTEGYFKVTNLIRNQVFVPLLPLFNHSSKTTESNGA